MLRRSAGRWAPPTDIHAALRILGLDEGVGAAGVREAYLKLARAHHPDLQGGDDRKMKVINVAYETLQLHGTGGGGGRHAPDAGADAPASEPVSWTKRRAVQQKRMADLVDDEFDTWNQKTTHDWTAAVHSVTEAERSNPANNPRSHSRFFSLEDDIAIYRLLRSGATVPQVARSLHKSALFVGKRVHNAQFKLRVQQVLRQERRGEAKPADPLQRGAAGVTIRGRGAAPETLGPSERWERMQQERGGGVEQWSATSVLSALGQNYAAYRRFHPPRA